MQTASDQMAAAQQAGLSSDELSTIRVFQANTPSVVNVTNIRSMQSYYTMDIEKIPAGTGSGFLWDKNGEWVRLRDNCLPAEQALVAENCLVSLETSILTLHISAGDYTFMLSDGLSPEFNSSYELCLLLPCGG